MTTEIGIMKRENRQHEGEMTTLEGDCIPRPVRKKKGGLRLKAKHHRHLKKVLAATSACAILVGGTFGINALFFNEAAPNTVDDGFATVLYELPTDGSTPDMHSALENIGYMNARFRAQDVWYSEMDGSVDTMLSQKVNTWKQYSDGVLIQTDITTSSLINSAKQFCWVGDRVIWREAAGGPSTYDGVNTAWKDGAPFGNMSVEDYKKSRGLPGTEFSVYIINEETLQGASEVTDNGDGTYTQTYYLDPATDKAPAYYVNQMMFTGGLTSLPTFEHITVTYTFDSTWQVLSSYIDEAYTATKGLNAKCTAAYTTNYEYGTDRAYSDAYETYFKNYADKPATGAPEGNTLTAADCLAEAFAPVLTKPVTFAVDLTLNGRPVSGLVYVDASDLGALSLRAKLGDVYFEYAGDSVCLILGENKIRLDTDALAGLTGGDGGSFDTDALLEQLGGGIFEEAGDGKSATLSSTLSLFGLDLPVRFTFGIADDGAISLGDVSTELSAFGMKIAAVLAYSEDTLPAEDVSDSHDVTSLVTQLAQLFTGDAIAADLSYETTAGGERLSLDGNISLDLASLGVKGDLHVSLGDGSVGKTLTFAYTAVGEGQEKQHQIYFTIDGAKFRLNASEAVSFLAELLGADLSGAGDALGDIFGKLLSIDLGSMITVADDLLVLAGGELLAALGVDFALGDVSLYATEKGVGVSALGIAAELSSAQPFTVNDGDYADYADLTPLLGTVEKILKDERIALAGSLSLEYRQTALSLAVENGTLSWKDGFALSFDLVVTVGDTRQTVLVDADASRIRLVYGNVGVELRYDELSLLADAFADVYARIASVLNASVQGGGLPATAEELSAQLGAGAAVTELLASLNLPELLSGISFGGATSAEGSLATLSFGAFTFDLRMPENGLALVLGKTSVDDITLSGSLSVAASSGDAVSSPAEGLMTVSDLCELLDFAGAAVATLASSDVTVSFGGSTLNADGQNVFDISGVLAYHSGVEDGRFPVIVDREGTSVTFSSDAYLYFGLTLDEIAEGGTDLYLDFWMFDAKDDGELDFYVSISKYAEGTPGYDPLRFAVSSSDILTILASGVSLFRDTLLEFLTGLGLSQSAADTLFSTLDAFFVSDWLTATDKAQLSAIGSMLMSTLGIDTALEDVLGGIADAVGGAAEDAAATDPGKYLTSLGITRGEDGTIGFTVGLDSDLIYGGTDLAPLTILLEKKDGADGSRLSGISLGNIYGNGNTEKTSVDFGFGYEDLSLGETADGATLTLADGTSRTLAYSLYSDYTFSGVDELIRAIAASATHETGTEGDYALNEEFYVSGKVSGKALGLSLTDIGIQIGVTVDAEGSVALHLKLTYSSFPMVIKSAGTTELTVKDGMVWIRRTLSGEQATYRVMPLNNFFNGILSDHLTYLLNFSDLIDGKIQESLNKPATASSGSDDYGIVLGNFLNSYTYQKNEDGGNTWKMNLNGASLTDGVLGDMLLTLGSDSGNILRTLGFEAGLYDDLLTLEAQLYFRNPCNVWESDAEKAAFESMDDLSDNFGRPDVSWETQDGAYFVEGKVTTVSFVAAGETVSAQNVLFDQASGTVYSGVTLPDLAVYQRPGYTVGWSKTDFTTVKENETVHAVYTPDVYTLTLVSGREAEGFTYDEATGKWVRVIEYTYGQFELPFLSDAQQRIIAYTADGIELTADSDGLEILSDLTLEAQWEMIDYTITYVADGSVISEQTAHYGDAFEPPAAPEKPGYSFAGWGIEQDYVTQDAVFTAQYVPETYTVTLESERALDGFVYNEGSGMYERQFGYVYGTSVSLPSAVRSEGYFLDGFVLDGVVYTQLPAVTEDVTLTAQWSEVGYEITFVADGKTILTQNYRAGETLRLPPVPEKTGYSGEWQVEEGYVVSGDATIEAVYTADTYTVKLVSDRAADGFAAADGAYVKEVAYVYDGAPVALDADIKVPGYDFGGYYTLPDGAGEKVTQIDNAVALGGVLYLVWIDNTVTVSFLSDLKLEGSSFNPAKNGYELKMSFNDDYTLNYKPAFEGYQLLGWFADAGNGWDLVSDVRALDGADVVAVWISEMQVTFTDVSKKSVVFGYTYNIVGEVRGGNVYGTLSESIAAAVSLTQKTEGFYRIYGKDGGHDDLKYGEVFELNYNSEGVAAFGATGMTSFKYGTLFVQAARGGVIISKTFSYGSASVTVDIEASAAIS